MDKLSGLILDHYDDPNGEVLKGIFPAKEDVPEFVKQAHDLSERDRAVLPDEAFALVLIDGDVTLRKYACVDAGNTALSVEYFLHEGHKLPEQAQKVAAENLMTACGWYGLPKNNALEKVAFGQFLAGLAKGGIGGLASKAMGAFKENPVGTALSALGHYQTFNAVKDAFGQAKQNLQNVGQAGMVPGGQRALPGGF